MMWYFNKLRPGDKIRESIEGEFFSTDAIRSPDEALVREGIQNSLDAAMKDDTGQPADTVRVRIFLATGHHALAATKTKTYFEGSWPHFRAEKNGLRNAPSDSDECPFLVFEDFGTTGLQGNVNQCFYEPGVKNPFFYFFRAEGSSEKGEEDRGRWGVGKHVFLRSSRASSFFGLTVRADDKLTMLMGSSVLKSHLLGGVHYAPDGFFGVPRTDGLVLPCQDSQVIKQFIQDFCIQRRNEPGLSIVVPWIDEDFTKDTLVETVVCGYFYPILTGDLAVTVETPESKIEIDDSTLISTVKNLGNETTEELLPLVELAAWASEQKPQQITKLNHSDPDRPAWRPDIIPSERLKPMKQSLQAGERLAVRATLSLREKGQTPRESYFDFFLVQDGHESGRPTFIRDGIIISDVRAARARGIRSLVIIEHKPIATLLGDSENPAHTQWQKDSSNFKGKYAYGPSYLDFVTRSVSALVAFLSEQEKEEDPTLLLDIFSLPVSPEEEEPMTRTTEKKHKGTVSDEKEIEIEPRKKRFRLHKVAGGFSIVPGDEPVTVGCKLHVQVAYDVRRGSPLKKYHPADFELGQGSVRLDPAPVGLKVVMCERNQLEVEVLNSEFNLTVVGFDRRRDVFVKPALEEASNDTQV